MSARVAVMSDVRARLSGQPGWKLDRFGNWVLGDRRFKVSARQLNYQRKVGDRWNTYRRWCFSQIDWEGFAAMKRVAEQRHARVMEQAKQFQADHPDKVVEVGIMVRVKENPDKDGVEVKFSDKPGEDILTAMRSHGFHWSKRQRLWYAKRTPAAVAFANSLRGPAVEREHSHVPAEPRTEQGEIKT